MNSKRHHRSHFFFVPGYTILLSLFAVIAVSHYNAVWFTLGLFCTEILCFLVGVCECVVPALLWENRI